MNNQDLNVKIDISQTVEVKCECNKNIFTEATMLRKLPALLSPTGQTAYIPIPVMVCQCGKVLKEMLPKEYQ
jgi:hypothetical protein